MSVALVMLPLVTAAVSGLYVWRKGGVREYVAKQREPQRTRKAVTTLSKSIEDMDANPPNFGGAIRAMVDDLRRMQDSERARSLLGECERALAAGSVNTQNFDRLYYTYRRVTG